MENHNSRIHATKVLILAAMNIAAPVIGAEKRGLGASQNDIRRIVAEGQDA